MRARSSLRAKNFAAPVANNNHHHTSSFGGKNNNHHLYNHDVNDLVCTNNIMFDSRVCRGNTYAAPVLTEDQNRMRKIKERKHLARLARKEEYRERTLPRPNTPPAVEGRVHIAIQTDDYLEEITVHPHDEDGDKNNEKIDRTSVESQTAEWKKPVPSFDIPYASPHVGKEVQTQIQVGELFDFDSEVQPLLDILVGETLQNAKMELSSENEIQSIQRKKKVYELKRQLELEELERLELPPNNLLKTEDDANHHLQVSDIRNICVKEEEIKSTEKGYRTSATIDEKLDEELARTILDESKRIALDSIGTNGYQSNPEP